MSASTGDHTRDLDAGSSESRIEREARRLVERVVRSVASSARSQFQE